MSSAEAQPRERTAVVVGATGGIGGAIARSLAARGYRLALNGRREEPLVRLAQELGAEYVVGDCNDTDVVQRLVRSFREDGIDVLVHGAGILMGTRAAEQSVETFEEVIDVNLRSAYLLVHEALASMNVGGRIILVSSLAATSPMRGLTAYSAAKAGLNAMAAALAAEVERDGINVSLCSPGTIDTPMMDVSANAFAALPPEDVGEVAAWLADLPPRIVVPDILFRAPFRGPFAEMTGGKGSVGMDLSADRDAKRKRGDE